MAIKKLKLDEIVTNTFPHHATRKINEIIDYLNSQEDDDWATPEQIEEYRKQDIGIDTSSPFEQEPNKVELVPLDERAIWKIYGDFTWQHRWDTVSLSWERWDKFKSVMYKYWVPKQKKYKKPYIIKWVWQDALSLQSDIQAIEYFLKSHNMLEE